MRAAVVAFGLLVLWFIEPLGAGETKPVVSLQAPDGGTLTLTSAQVRQVEVREDAALERIEFEKNRYAGRFKPVNPLYFQTGRAKIPG